MSPSSHAPRRFLPPSSTTILSVGLALALAACAAVGVNAIASTGLVALNVLRKAFIGVAGSNYGDGYKEDADKLFQVMAKPITPPTAPGAPGQPVPGQPFPGQPVPGQPVPGQPVAGQPLPGQPAPGQPVAGQPAGAPAVAGAPIPGAMPAPGTPGGVPAMAAGPLAIEVGVLREEIVDGRSIPVPVQDGEVLYDRFGTHGEGDNIKFMFRANVDAYVYVVAIDGTGWIQPVFPSGYAGFANPVKANQTYLFPEGATWAPLDSYRGVEHLYFIASRFPRPDLEKSLVAIASHLREVDSTRKESDKELLASVVTEAPIARGFDTARKSVVTEVPSATGEKFPVDAQIFASNGQGEIVVTRWFRHQ
jgi:hypothetical protein